MDEKIVNLGAFRARLQRAAGGNSSVCRHKHVIIDPDAGPIFCDDCKAYVSAFHTVVSWVGHWEEVVEAVNIQKRRLAAIWRTARTYRLRMRPSQELERPWWRRGVIDRHRVGSGTSGSVSVSLGWGL